MTTNQIFIKIRTKMRAYEAKTCALAMPYKDSDPSQQKSRKCVFRRFLNRHQKKIFYSLFQSRQKYYESSKTEYSDSTSFINRLTPLKFFLWSWNFENFDFFLLLSHDNRLTWVYSLFTASYDDYSCQNLTKKMPEGVFSPPLE